MRGTIRRNSQWPSHRRPHADTFSAPGRLASGVRRHSTTVGRYVTPIPRVCFRPRGSNQAQEVKPLPTGVFEWVDAGGLKPNTWQRFERLSSAWKQAKIGAGDEPQGAVEDESGVVVNPRRRARTPLTNRQVDAIRTARANGESVVSICRRFDVHRMTVWTYTNGSHRASK